MTTCHYCGEPIDEDEWHPASLAEPGQNGEAAVLDFCSRRCRSAHGGDSH